MLVEQDEAFVDEERTEEPLETSDSTKRWVKKDIDLDSIALDDGFPTPTNVLPSIDYFWSLFPLEMVDHITHQTNLYARQKSIVSSFVTSKDEIVQFLGILMYMGIGQYPSLDDYWATETRVPQVANVMSSKRFRLLRRTIHFNDSMLVHLYKTPMKAKRWRLRVRYRFSFFAFYSFFSSLFPLWVEVEG